MLTAATVIAAAMLLPASGGLPCKPRDAMLDDLAARYGEAPVPRGLTLTGVVLEVLASPGGATWTLLLSRADGVSCAIAAGTDLEARKPKPGGAPA